MFKTAKEFDRSARRLLQSVIDGSDLSDCDDKSEFVIHECVERGYLDGVCSLAMEDGSYRSIVKSKVTVTQSGLAYLHPKRDWKFIIATAIAVAELIVIIIQTIQNAAG